MMREGGVDGRAVDGPPPLPGHVLTSSPELPAGMQRWTLASLFQRMSAADSPSPPPAKWSFPREDQNSYFIFQMSLLATPAHPVIPCLPVWFPRKSARKKKKYNVIIAQVWGAGKDHKKKKKKISVLDLLLFLWRFWEVFNFVWDVFFFFLVSGE